MRPEVLNPLFVEAGKLRGVGPKVAASLDRLLGGPARPARVIDLVLHLPISVIDRSTRAKIREAPRDQVVTLEGRVREHLAPASVKAPFKAVIEDETGDCTLVFFRNNAAWVEKALPVGATRFVSGRLEVWDGRLQMVHPDRVMDAEAFATMPLVEPVYPLTEGLFPRVLGKAIEAALERLPPLPEWQDPNRFVLRGWPGFAEALRAVHHPKKAGEVGVDTPARQRLAYDELLASQLALALVRNRAVVADGVAHPSDGRISSRIEAALPFTLTGGQRKALGEIRADMASPKRMLRLLQGDVGSGKTVVALLAAASAVEAGVPGRPDGPDRDPGAPAFRPRRAARRRGGPAGRRADGARQGLGAGRHPGRPRRWQHRPRGRHARAVLRGRGLPRPRPSWWSTSSTASVSPSG